MFMQRITLRDRTYERSMERAYIAELGEAYEEFFNSQNGPVLRIDTTPYDFVRQPEHLKLIENRIRESLNMNPYQPRLLNVNGN